MTRVGVGHSARRGKRRRTEHGVTIRIEIDSGQAFAYFRGAEHSKVKQGRGSMVYAKGCIQSSVATLP